MFFFRNFTAVLCLACTACIWHSTHGLQLSGAIKVQEVVSPYSMCLLGVQQRQHPHVRPRYLTLTGMYTLCFRFNSQHNKFWTATSWQSSTLMISWGMYITRLARCLALKQARTAGQRCAGHPHCWPTSLSRCTPSFFLPSGFDVNGERQTIAINFTVVYSPAEEDAVYDQLLADPAVDILLVPQGSDVLTELVPALNETNKVAISCCGRYEEKFRSSSLVFSVLPPGPVAMEPLLQTFANRNLSTAVIVSHPGGARNDDLCNVSALPVLTPVKQPKRLQLLTKLFVENAVDVSAGQIDPSINAALDYIVANQPDLVLSCMDAFPSLRFLQVAADRRVDMPARIFPITPQALGAVQPEVLPYKESLLQPEMYNTFLRVSDPSLDNDEILEEGVPPFCVPGKPCWSPADFYREYYNAYGVQANLIAPAAFAVVQVAVTAAMRAENISGDPLGTILVTRGFPTVLGQLRFDKDGVVLAGRLSMQLQPPGVEYVVEPDHLANAPLIARAPTWAQRECLATDQCGSHGTCESDGSCACSPAYIGSTCNVPLLAIILVPVLILLLCCLGQALLVQRQRARMRLDADEAKQVLNKREVAEEATRSAMQDTLDYALSGFSLPLAAALTAIARLNQQAAEETGPASAPPHAATVATARAVVQAGQEMERVLLDMRAAGGTLSVDPRSSSCEPVRLGEMVADMAYHLQHVFAVLAETVVDFEAARGVFMLQVGCTRQLLVACSAAVAAATSEKATKLAPMSSPETPQAESSFAGVVATGCTDDLASPQGPPGLGSSRDESRCESSTCSGHIVPSTATSMSAVPVVATVHIQQLAGVAAHAHSPLSRMRSSTGPTPRTGSSADDSSAQTYAVFTVMPVAALPADGIHALRLSEGMPGAAEEHEAAEMLDMATPEEIEARIRSVSLSGEEESASDEIHVIKAAFLRLLAARVLATAGIDGGVTDGQVECWSATVAEAFNGADGAQTSEKPRPSAVPTLVSSLAARAQNCVLRLPVCTSMANRLGGSLFTCCTTEGHPVACVCIPCEPAPAGASPVHNLLTVPAAGPTDGDGASVISSASCIPRYRALRSQAASSEPEGGSANRPVVMVVDDERVNVRLTSVLLQKLGYDVISCNDGDQVVSALENSAQPVRLILLDIVMKRMNGLEAARAVHAAGYAIPLVAMTANVQTHDLAQYDAAGFVATLAKPFGVAALRRTCREVILATNSPTLDSDASSR